jgi:AAA+ superfamily predicted ATPase
VNTPSRKDFERQGWDSIGGQAETKLALQQALEWPVKFPQTFARLGVKPPRGVLLYGPPGCSKSSIVRAAAHSSGATFLSLSAAQVFSPFFGDAEAAVRQVFRDARAALPAIVFFDEIDVMVAKRAFDGSGGGEGGSSTAMRVLSTMLNEMDGVESAEGLLVIGATNRPACIDAALMRPGRFDRILFVELPEEADRVDILRIHSRPMQLHEDVDLHALARRTPYFSGAELEVRRNSLLDGVPGLLTLTGDFDRRTFVARQRCSLCVSLSTPKECAFATSTKLCAASHPSPPRSPCGTTSRSRRQWVTWHRRASSKSPPNAIEYIHRRVCRL